MGNIHFNKQYQSAFWEELREDVKNYFEVNKLSPYASKGLWAKMIFLLSVYIGLYLSLFILPLKSLSEKPIISATSEHSLNPL